jgi:hypothetical protein
MKVWPERVARLRTAFARYVLRPKPGFGFSIFTINIGPGIRFGTPRFGEAGIERRRRGRDAAASGASVELGRPFFHSKAGMPVR